MKLLVFSSILLFAWCAYASDVDSDDIRRVRKSFQARRRLGSGGVWEGCQGSGALSRLTCVPKKCRHNNHECDDFICQSGP